MAWIDSSGWENQMEPPPGTPVGSTWGVSTQGEYKPKKKQKEAAAPPPDGAMQGLSAIAGGEGLAEGLFREGWNTPAGTELAVPGQRMLPASSRALQQIVQQRGKAY